MFSEPRPFKLGWPRRNREKLSEYNFDRAEYKPWSTKQFINIATGQQSVHIINGTQDINTISCSHPDGSGCKVIFVDTPGFDDSQRTGYDIPTYIANWLAEMWRFAMTEVDAYSLLLCLGTIDALRWQVFWYSTESQTTECPVHFWGTYHY